ELDEILPTIATKNQKFEENLRKKFISKIAKSGILEFCWLYLSAKCIKKTSWFMLYSGIHYVSPAGDFCPKLHVLNL
ncbi:MAG: hypothetical protein QF618_04680, partial [SAR324 cluster bacterium]|nr:hypothetical protein [SAR324 cluster bacterium]